MTSTRSESTESSNAEGDIIPGFKNVADFTKDGFKCLMEGIKHANSLPTGRDWNFYTTFESFTNTLKEESQQLMNDMTTVLKNEVGANMRNQSMEKKTEILIEANDLILERVANNIDEMNGIRKTTIEPIVLQAVSAELPVNINGSWNRTRNATFTVSSSLNLGTKSPASKQTTIRLLTAENIARPQKFFKDKIDNRNDYPWEPRIKEKPNSLKPLAMFLEETENGRGYSHPYEFELDRFAPPENLLNKTKVNKPKLLKSTPLVEINDSSQLSQLVDELRQFKTIAVDLEHHSYRTFMGITCLMQVSTIEKDYLIDTLALRNDLWVLNEIFTKPDVTKVFHGADSDILWLQRDLSLYVVNMFDTYFAAKQLEYSGLSLAYLMQRFCSFTPNKQFQLADWRIRPLPDQLKSYAREDTHYLIYIYQNMRNELIDKAHGKSNLLKAVIDQSTSLCKKRYSKPLWHDNSHLEFYGRCRRMFDNRQLFALKEIYKWRDHIARIEDESVGYVLPNNMLLEIAGRLPKEMQGILACCSPVPPLVKANLLELHKIVLIALETPFEEPILKEDIRARGSTKKLSKINVDSPLHCPHDMTRNGEFRDDLPTLLNSFSNDEGQTAISSKLGLEQAESVCSIFNLPNGAKVEKGDRASEKLRKFRESFKFLGPFERYKLVKPFIEAKEKKLAEERAKEEEENAKKQVTDVVKQEDYRTDEERIESIREHFLQLNRKPMSPTNMSLREMGGGTKRKRDESILLQNENPDPQTPITNLQITLHTDTNTGRKRKSIGDDEVAMPGPSKVPRLSRRQRNKMKMAKRKEKRARANDRANANGGEARQVLIEGSPSSLQATAVEDNSNGPAKRGKRMTRGRGGRSSRGNFKNRIDNFNQRELQNPRADFSAYDYSMVDFRQFQGGARGVEKTKLLKTTFKARGKPSLRGGKNQNNKSMTFGRGRGR